MQLTPEQWDFLFAIPNPIRLGEIFLFAVLFALVGSFILNRKK